MTWAPCKNNLASDFRLLFPGPGKNNLVRLPICCSPGQEKYLVQTSNLLVPGPGKSKLVQTSNLLCPGHGEVKFVQTSSLLFPGPAKSLVQTSKLLFPGRGKSSIDQTFNFLFPVLEPNCFVSARDTANWKADQNCFFHAREKQIGSPTKCAFPGPGKTN